MLSQLVVQQVSQLLDFPYGAAMGGILLIVTLVIVGLLARVIRSDAAYAQP
jgi:ABC-type spermidine/putrescine transport system permease subunit I